MPRPSRKARTHQGIPERELRAMHRRADKAREKARKARQEQEANQRLWGSVTVKQAGRIIDEQRAVASQLSRVPGGSGYIIGV